MNAETPPRLAELAARAWRRHRYAQLECARDDFGPELTALLNVEWRRRLADPGIAVAAGGEPVDRLVTPRYALDVDFAGPGMGKDPGEQFGRQVEEAMDALVAGLLDRAPATVGPVEFWGERAAFRFEHLLYAVVYAGPEAVA